jgi:uncharacterized membrane protein
MAFCANCGASVTGRFCQKCGAPTGDPIPGATTGAAPGATPPPGAMPYNEGPGLAGSGIPPLPPPPAATIGMTDNLAGALCYLVGFITGILFLVLAPYNQNRNVRFHAFQSIFLNIAWIVLWIAITIVMLFFHLIPFLGLFISLVLRFTLGLGGFILWLYMMFKTYNGEKVILPVIGPMADRQAGV